MPNWAKKYLLKIQGQIKAERGLSVFSIESTIYQILKEHKELKKQTLKSPAE